jgi:hypothetical protein
MGKFVKELVRATMIRRPIHQEETPLHVVLSLENGSRNEEGPLPPSSDIEALIPETEKYTPGVALRRQPVPSELAPEL